MKGVERSPPAYYLAQAVPALTTCILRELFHEPTLRYDIERFFADKKRQFQVTKNVSTAARARHRIDRRGETATLAPCPPRGLRHAPTTSLKYFHFCRRIHRW